MASVLCATDTVAALAIVKDSEFPTLNSILFGEGVVNDGVSILLFKAVEKVIASQGASAGDTFSITSDQVFGTLLNFLIISVVSILMGLAFGLFSAFVFKRLPSLNHHPVEEIFLIILIAYLSYLVAEMAEMSGIMSLFVCGVTMSHYSYHNISKESQSGSVLLSNTLAHLAEAFLFTYLGLALFSINE